MVEEISADITAYKKQYERILFVVYDLGVIRDEVEFKRDIEMTDGVKVIVVKHWSTAFYRYLSELKCIVAKLKELLPLSK